MNEPSDQTLPPDEPPIYAVDSEVTLAGTIERIKAELAESERSGTKMATFHLWALQCANDVERMGVKAWSAAVGVPASYSSEASKMLALAKVIQRKGLTLR